MTLVTAVKNIIGFLIDTFVGAVVDAIMAPATFALSIVKVGSVFAGSLM
jgi:hypothetical protein